MCTHATITPVPAFVYMGLAFVCTGLGIPLKREHVWVFMYWLYCISCTYGKRKKKFTKKKKEKRTEISGKSQNFRNENFVGSSKNLLKSKNWTFPVVHCFTWKLEFVSNIWWILLVSSQVEHSFNMIKKLCNIHSFLFRPYKYQNATNAQKRQHYFWRQLDCNFLI